MMIENAKYRILYKFVVKEVEDEIEGNLEDGILTELDRGDLDKLDNPILEYFNRSPWTTGPPSSNGDGYFRAWVAVPGKPGDVVDISITFAHTALKPYSMGSLTVPDEWVTCYEYLGMEVRPTIWSLETDGFEVPAFGTGKFYTYESGGRVYGSVGARRDVFTATASNDSMWYFTSDYQKTNSIPGSQRLHYDPENDIVSLHEQKNSKPKTVYKFIKRIKITDTGGFEELADYNNLKSDEYSLAIEVFGIGNILRPRTTPDTIFGTLKDTVVWIYDVTATVNGVAVEKYQPSDAPGMPFFEDFINIKPSGSVSNDTFIPGNRQDGAILISNAYKYAPWERYPTL